MKMKVNIFDEFPYARPETILAFKLVYKKETSLEEKFGKLLKQNPYGFIHPSYPVFGSRLNQREKYQQVVNAYFVEEATKRFCLPSFRGDVIRIAKRWSLDKTKYLIEEKDFDEYFFLPAHQLFERELTLALLVNKHPAIKKQMAEAGLELPEYLSPAKWREEIAGFMEKYGLEGYWKESVTSLFLSGKWFLPRNASIIHIDLYNDRRQVDPKIYLEIFPSTPSKELEMRWYEIQPLKKYIFRWDKKKNKTRENLIDILRLDTSEKRWNYAERKLKNPTGRKKLIDAILKKQKRVIKDFQESKKRSLKILPKFIQRQLDKTKQPITKVLIY